VNWFPLPAEPRRYIVSGVDDLGHTVWAEYPRENKDSALCHIDEIRRHGGRAILGRVIGDEPVTPAIIGVDRPGAEGSGVRKSET
jgi:hypothetical protein